MKITDERLVEIAGTLPAFLAETTSIAQELIQLRKIEAAAALVTKFNLTNICGMVAHKPLRHPLCGHCRLAARIEELAAALEGK